MNTMEINKNDLRPIRCSNCGRFLGFEHIVIGVVQLKCKNCKMFTTILGEETDLTKIAELVKIK